VSVVEPTARPGAAIGAGVATRAGDRASVSAWRYGIVALVLLIWLVPIRRYRVPLELPFNPEPYRIMILVLLGVLAVAVLSGRGRISAAGHGKALLVLALAALVAQTANFQRINEAGQSTQALKSLSYFLSALLAFLIVASVVRSLDDVEAVIAALVIGAALIALAAVYESRTAHNLFLNLDSWVPLLEETGEDPFNVRGGRLRVRASAQHPIALAAALAMIVPLALYMAQRAATLGRRFLWILAAFVIGVGALATISRTAVLVFAAMAVVGLVLRGRSVLRWAPLVLVLAIVAQQAAPGSVRQLYRAFTPHGGLISEQTRRTDLAGSGRVSDLGPGIELWSERPLFGRGLELGRPNSEPSALDPVVEAGVIYDNQYLTTLVGLGAFGLIGFIWFFWGGVVKLGRAARRTAGSHSDLLAACTAATAGFAAGMFTYDAFAFVQVTVFAFMIAALGLRARALAQP
jgi:hypothetical protein